MTEETEFGNEHLTVVMTTTRDDDVTHTTVVTSAAASSASRGVSFYFECVIVAVGAIGMIANGLLLYAFVASKQHKKKPLIFNQNVLDFFGSLWLVIAYSVKLCNIHFTGLSGYLLCVLILSEHFSWATLMGSRINLSAVTIERYLKVVHNAWSKKWLRNWMIKTTMVFSWFAGFVGMTPMVFKTTAVVDGKCYALVFWESRTAQLGATLWYFITVFLFLLFVFVYCYGHILVMTRRQARVMAAHNQASCYNAAQNQTDRKIKTNIIKTMIIVSVFFVLCNFPNELVFLLLTVDASISLTAFGYYSTVFLLYLYGSFNPFIYAIKFDPVKRVLLNLIPCKR